MILMILLSTGLTVTDPFAGEKITMDVPLDRPLIRLSIHRDRIVRGAMPSAPLSQHDDAAETSGPVIRTEKGLLHCKGHTFPAVADKK